MKSIGESSSTKNMEILPSPKPINNKTDYVQISDDAIAGAFAGTIARLLTAPFDIIKIRFQLQNSADTKYRSMYQAIRCIIAEEGILSLWKGNLSATYLWITYAIVQFTTYGFLKRLGETIPEPAFLRSSYSSNSGGSSKIPLEKSDNKKYNSNNSNNNKLNPSKSPTPNENSKLWCAFMLFLAGAGAGIISTIATYPFDIMRTQFALQGKDLVYKSMGSFIYQTYQVKGLSGFYAGLAPSVIGITPYMGLNFALYETFKKIKIGSRNSEEKIDYQSYSSTSSKNNNHSNNKDKGDLNDSKAESPLLSMLKKGLCGGMAGGISKFIVYPLDTIKKRLQSQTLANTFMQQAAATTARMTMAGQLGTIASSGIAQNLQYKGVLHCFQSIYTNEGIKGFYKGISPTIVKSVVATAITFAAYEGAKDLLSHRRNIHKNNKNSRL